MAAAPNPPDDRQTADEMARVEAEPLLPIEKKLITGSLLLGFALLGLLWWISARYFPATVIQTGSALRDFGSRRL